MQIPALPAQGLVLWEVRYPAEPPESGAAGEIPPGPLLFPF
jgi:hypothetical protein